MSTNALRVMEPNTQDPSLSHELLVQMYRHLLLTRTVENKIAYIGQNQNMSNPLIIGKGYLSTGQEAVSVGAALALEDGDWLAPSHRDLGAQMVRGVTLQQVFAQYFVRLTGPTRGRDANVHFGDTSKKILSFVSHMGSWLVVGNGIAAAMKYRNEPGVVLGFFGDGASSQGIVHEAMNYAAVFKLPVVFVVNNNGYAISTPVEAQMAVSSIATRAAGYGMSGVTVDGNHVTDVFVAVRHAVKKARKGEGPSLIECKTFRVGGHGTHDPASYVPKELKESWKARDPLKWFSEYLKTRKILSDDNFSSIQKEIQEAVEEAVSWAREQPKPTAEDLWR